MRTSAAIACLVLAAPAGAAPPQVVNPEIVSTRTHDSSCYTQGLLLHDGSLYESCGGYGGNSYGPSTLREVNPSTGAVIRSVTLDGQYFAEGLALVGNHLIQLTWQEQVALVWDITTFAEVDQFSYTGEGWGLCYDGTRLVMSDGSDRLTFRDPTDFHVLGHVDVTLENPPGTINSVNSLNELECVGTSVYANIYSSSYRWIVEIDAATGVVTRWIQAPTLHSNWIGDWDRVLNGTAYDAASGNFLITGKLWPDLFEVRFGNGSPADGAPTDGAAPGDPPPATGDPVPPGPGDPKPPADGKVSSKGCSAAAPWWLPMVSLCLLCRPRSRR